MKFSSSNTCFFSTLAKGFALIVVLWCIPAVSLEHYKVDNSEWNGLSEFMKMANEMGVKIVPRTVMDFGELSKEDNLLILFPQEKLDAEPLLDFMGDGGRVLLADDFGQGAGLMNQVDVKRAKVPAMPPHAHFRYDNVGLPIFTTHGKHELLEGVKNFTGNHTAYLTSEYPAIVYYDDTGYGFAYDLNVGEGKLIILGDSSLFINLMTGLEGNRQFVRNAIKYACRGKFPCTLQLYSSKFESRNSYPLEKSKTPARRFAGFLDFIKRFNQVLDRLGGKLPYGRALYIGSVILMIGIIFFLVTLFPMVKSSFLRFSFRPECDSEGVSEFEWNLSRFDKKGRGADYGFPLSILREEFERRFVSKMEADGIITQEILKKKDRLDIFVDTYLRHYYKGRSPEKTRSKLRSFLFTLAKIPPRHRIYQEEQLHKGERELTELYEFGRDTLRVMGTDFEHE